MEVKRGNLVIWKGGLFRVHTIAWDYDKNGNRQHVVGIGELFVPIEEVTKADWRDETRILKYDYENKW